MLHNDMASHYIRKASPFYYLKYQRTDGTWGDKTSGIRVEGDGSLRKIKQMVAQHTMNEAQFDKNGGSHRFDGWVPQFLGSHFPNSKTVARYMSAWSALSTYLEHCKIISPLQVTYRICIDYPQFRTTPPGKIIRRRSFNTALTELKVFSAILQEAIKRGYITANPCLRLGLKRTRPKQKPEITRDEQERIERELATRDQWMRDCWLVAMRQGCRLSETAVPLTHIDTETGTVMFFTKGGRVHTAPLHGDLLPLLRVARRKKRANLVELPKYPAKKWHQFFKRIGLPHLSFHCTRVTVVTRLARKGHTMTQTKAYVGHASDNGSRYLPAACAGGRSSSRRGFVQSACLKSGFLRSHSNAHLTVERPPGIWKPAHFIRLMKQVGTPSAFASWLTFKRSPGCILAIRQNYGR